MFAPRVSIVKTIAEAMQTSNVGMDITYRKQLERLSINLARKILLQRERIARMDPEMR